jgi:hypothetical protein
MTIGLWLTILFVVLQVTHVISWSLWLVFLPLIIEAVVDVILFIVFGAAVLNVFTRHRRLR